MLAGRRALTSLDRGIGVRSFAVGATLDPVNGRGWRWFFVWTLLGAVLGLTVSPALALVASPVALIGVLVLGLATGWPAEALGLAAGAGALFAVLAWRNAVADTGFDPVHWGAAAAGLLLVGVGGYLAARRRRA